SSASIQYGRSAGRQPWIQGSNPGEADTHAPGIDPVGGGQAARENGEIAPRARNLYAITASSLALPFAECVQKRFLRLLGDVLFPQPRRRGPELPQLLQVVSAAVAVRQVPLELGELGRREAAFEIVVHQLDHLLAGELSRDVDHALLGVARFSRSIKWSPTRSALAMMVSAGFTAPDEGKKLAS